MPRKSTNTAPAEVTKSTNTAPAEDVEKDVRIAELEKQLAEAQSAKEDAELGKLEAEQAAAIKEREEKAEVEIDPEDKKVLDALAEGKSAELVADKLGLEKGTVIRVAYENMNNESVYQLAERLGVKVNELYDATDQKDMIRYIQEVDEDGKRHLKRFDYEA